MKLMRLMSGERGTEEAGGNPTINLSTIFDPTPNPRLERSPNPPQTQTPKNPNPQTPKVPNHFKTKPQNPKTLNPKHPHPKPKPLSNFVLIGDNSG